MKKRLLPALWVSLGLLISVGVMIAHHGTAAYKTKLTTVKGVVTDFLFINPHSEVYFDVKNDKGETEKWIAEGNSATVMARFGWTQNSLKPGVEISATGNRSKERLHDHASAEAGTGQRQRAPRRAGLRELLRSQREVGSGGSPKQRGNASRA